MAPLKFRAWDKNAKTMVVGEMEWFDDMIGFRFEHWCGETDTSENIADHVVVMQSTGLKDSKGAEIYEGDIIMFPQEKDGHTVVFEEGGFMAISSWGKTLEDKQKVRAHWWWKGGYGEPEVIGNIYENPQLLNAPS